MEMKTKLSQTFENYPIVFALITQALVLFLLRNIFVILKFHSSGILFTFIQSTICFLIYKIVFKFPKWFLYLAFLIPFTFFFAFHLNLHASIYGFIFLLLFLTFSHTLRERVPLYLSNDITANELKKIIENKFDKKINFMDLGSGTGRVVRALSQSEKINSFGTETAPIIFLYSYIFSLFSGGKILRKSIWDIDLSNYNGVYTFLSPAVMDKIHEKFQKEMTKDSMLISNSFPIENLRPSEVITLNDQRKTKFYIYVKN